MNTELEAAVRRLRAAQGGGLVALPDANAAALEADIAVVLDALSTPPADDVREAHRKIIVEGEIEVCSGCRNSLGYNVAWDQAHGTVSDADVEAASEQFATSILVPERETRLAQSSFVAGVEWRERAAREARS